MQFYQSEGCANALTLLADTELVSKLSIDFYSKIMRTGYSSFNIGGMENGCY